ncbi:MAG TPA: TIR domain-containing protein [Steroidobacteraceae bacterium]|nr:TIR domain-containing protein [Steroidobacteraceae bacterium]
MADVFISYARVDKARVAPLVAAIEAKGWSVWWDPAIAPGQEFDRQITKELENAAAVLVVWTPTSVESRWVRGEAREGADRGILVPVRLDRASLPIDVRAIHTTDLDESASRADSPQFQEVLRALEAVIARRSGGDTRTARQEPAQAAPAPKPSRTAVCVLPFTNMSGDPEQEYFSDGITEDIITDLTKVSALVVISRNSAFVYKGRNVEVPKIARDLDASHVLEGSVRKAGGRVRITAQLILASSNDHVWAERYDRDLNDIFALQDEISQAIVKALRVKLLPAEKEAIEQRGTGNVEAYNLYLMAWQQYVNNARNEEDVQAIEKIVRLSTRATEIDPGYAQAWALLALGQMVLHLTHRRPGDGGLMAIERALELDPRSAETHAIKSKILWRQGRQDEAFAEIDVALRLDPDSFEANRTAGLWNMRTRRFADSIRYYEKALAHNEADFHTTSTLVTCYTAIGDHAGAERVSKIAVALAEKVLAHDQDNWVAVSYGAVALAVLGEPERAKAWMNRALLIEPNRMEMRFNFACALASNLGENDAALDMLAPVMANVTPGFLSHIKVDADLDTLRDDPRYQDMVATAEARHAAAAASPGSAS